MLNLVLLVFLVSQVSAKVSSCDEIRGEICVIDGFSEDQDVVAPLNVPVSEIKVVNSVLKWIPAQIFRDFDAIEVFEADNSTIKTLFSNLNATKLRTLRLRNCGIAAVKENFKGSVGITELDLSQNSLRRLGSETFSRLKRLKVLDLAYNELKNVSRKLLEGNVMLQSLNLTGNFLKTLDPGLFGPLKSLKVLKLGDNKLESFSLKFGNSTLEVLEVQNNRLKHLNITTQNSHAMHLDVFAQNNRIRGVSVEGFSVSFLSLPNNKIASTDFLCGLSFKSLNFLNLQENLIERVTCLGELRDLWELNVARNDLEEFPVREMEELENLIILYLFGNRNLRIRALDVAETFPKLEIMDISEKGGIPEPRMAELEELKDAPSGASSSFVRLPVKFCFICP